MSKEYGSPFKIKIEAYVNLRRAQGYKFESGEQAIRRFDDFAVAVGWKSEVLTKDIVKAYIAPRPGEKPATRGGRMSAIRCFGRYLAANGDNAYVLPKGEPAAKKYCFEPRLLTEDEMVRFLHASESLPYSPTSPRRHIVMPMIFRTMYACGLRISEACKLTVSDVDLDEGTLLIHETKFNKSRRVPLSRPLQLRFAEYTKRIHPFSPPSAAFFPSPSGFYHRSSVGYVFKCALADAGIPHFDDGPTPHCLRHSFAVHRLMRWSAEDEDVAALLPYLSAYMGHDGLLGTERYLRMTMEMDPNLRAKVKKACSWILLGVANDD